MMKKLLTLAAVVFTSTPALAYPTYRYTADCYLETKTELLYDNCVVVETRENNGALRTRNIFSNRFGLTVKSWFDKNKGFTTWDSHNKFDYQWSYKIAEVEGEKLYSYVMPGFIVKDLPWD